MGSTSSQGIFQSNKPIEQKIQGLSGLIDSDPANHSSYYYRGLAYQQHEDFDQALQDFEKALKLKPSFQREIDLACTKLYCDWGKKLAQDGEQIQALRKFSQAYQMNPRDADLCYHMGLAYEALYCCTEAESSYSAAIRLNVLDATYHFRRAVVRQGLGRGVEAMEDADQTIAHLLEDHEEIHRGLAEIYAQNQSYEKAIQEYHKVLRVSFDDANIYYQRANTYLHLGKETEAIDDFRQALVLGHAAQQVILQAKARAYRDRANRASRSENYLEACADYNEYLEVFPEDHLVHYERGLNYFNMAMHEAQLRSRYLALALEDFLLLDGQNSESSQVFKQTVRGKIANTYELQGLEAFENQKHPETLLKFREVLRYSEDGSQIQKAYFYQGLAHYHLSQYTEAIGIFTKLSSPLPAFQKWLLANYFERSKVLLQEGRHQEALEDCERYLSISSANTEVYFTQGLAYEGLGQLEAARSALERAFQDHAVLTKISLVRVLISMTSLTTDAQKKVDLYTYRLSLGDVSPSLYEERAHCYLELEQYDAAIQDFEKYPEKVSKSKLQAYFFRAQAKLSAGSYQDAVADLRKYLQSENEPSLAPESQKAYYYLGVAYQHLLYYNSAIIALGRALSLKPDDEQSRISKAHAHLCRGHQFFEQQKYQEALQDYQECLRVDADNIDVYYCKGYANFVLKNYSEATLDFKRVLQLNSDHPEKFNLLNYLGYCYKHQNQFSLAIFSWEDAKKLSPQDQSFDRDLGEACLYMARMWHEEEKNDLALSYYDKSLQYDPHAEVFLERGSLKLSLNRDQEAREDFTKALRLKPQLVLAKTKLIQTYLKILKAGLPVDKSIELYMECIKLDDSQADFYYQRALLYQGRGDELRALGDFETAFEKRHSLRADILKDHYELSCAIIKKLLAQKKWQEILVLSGRHLKMDKRRAEVFYFQGLAYEGLNQLLPSKQAFEAATALNPDDSSVKEALTRVGYLYYFNQGVEFHKQSRFERAIFAYTEAIKYQDQGYQVYCNRGLSYYQKQDYRNAISDLTRTLEIKPNQPVRKRYLASAYFHQGLYLKAIEHFELALNLPENVSDALAWKECGQARQKRGDHRKAIDDFTRSLGVDADRSEVLFLRGASYLEIKNLASAIADLKRSFEKTSSQETKALLLKAYRQRSEGLFDSGDYRGAIADFLAALRLDARDFWFLSRCGEAYRRLSEHQTACDYFSQALDVKPRDFWVLARLGTAKLSLKEYADAISCLDCLVVTDSEHAWILATLGEAKRMLGDYDGALKNLTTALELQPHNAWTLKVRGAVYFALEEFAKAWSDLTACVAIEPHDEFALSLMDKITKRATSPREKAVAKSVTIIPYEELEFIRHGHLGSGGFGTVTKAIWHGTEVAVKTLNQALSPSVLEQFKQEVNVHASLRHDHIVALRGICTDGKVCIVMELMAKGSLYDILHNRSEELRGYKIRVEMSRQIAAGLSYLHSQRIVHQDLKSPNILVEGFGGKLRLKISDFGLSKVRSSKGSIGCEGGTIRWMAPEVLEGEKSTYASDIWAMGIIFWEILSQALPFASYSTSRVARAITRGVRDEIPVGADSPRLLREVITRCWAERQERPTATEVESTLADRFGRASY